jgi:tetratricopeptide (TPR) repeat protein
MISVKPFFLILFLSFSIVSFSQNKIDLLLLNKNYKEALSEIDIQIVKVPSAQLYFKQGLIYNSLQNYQEALNSFMAALQLEPNNSQIISEIAEGLSIIGNQHDAVEFFKRAIELEPDNLTLKGKLGRVFINQKKIKLAYDVFAEIYTIDSTNVYWNKQLAFCSFRVGRRTQAVALYENALEVNPRDYGTYSNLIHTYSRRKEANEIMATIEKGLEQFPGDAGLILEKANFFFKTKRYGPAMIHFQKYFQADGDSIYEIAMNYAISTYFSKKENKALEILGDLFRANPNDPFVHFYMSLCNKRLKNFEEAEKMMTWAIESSIPDYVSEMQHHLGQIYGQQRKYKESIEALQKSYELKPINHEVLFEIATTYEEFNSNKTLALNYYRIYLENVGDGAKNVNYALDRITKLKEDLFFEE